MKCPHCTVEIHAGFKETWIANGNGLGREAIGSQEANATVWCVKHMVCPGCDKAILELNKCFFTGLTMPSIDSSTLIYPRSSSRAPAAAEVPAELAEDFDEACLVLCDSPKASAALSRRCLQALLRYKGYVQHDLAKAIDAILAAKALPSWLATNLDAVRNIGNFAAHTMKDSNSGAILPVEDHEAEWNLDVLEGLFDFFYVQPAKDAARVSALNAKLLSAGKPPIK